ARASRYGADVRVEARTEHPGFRRLWAERGRAVCGRCFNRFQRGHPRLDEVRGLASVQSPAHGAPRAAVDVRAAGDVNSLPDRELQGVEMMGRDVLELRVRVVGHADLLREADRKSGV